MACFLILTEPIHKLIPVIPKILKCASFHVRGRLYVHLDDSTGPTPRECESIHVKSHLISTIYSISPKICPGIDIRVLLYGFKKSGINLLQPKLDVQKVLINGSDGFNLSRLENIYTEVLGCNNFVKLSSQSNSLELDFINLKIFQDSEESVNENKIYNDVVLGGTFDRIHSGHKILLSDAILRCCNRLLIGITDGPLLKNKILQPLILPFETREKLLREFLTEVDSTLKYDLSRIIDPVGPAGTDPNLEMIIVSEETQKGVQMVNSKRLENGLNELDSVCIKIYEDCKKSSENEEDKFSSSSERMRLLGTRFRAPIPKPHLPNRPYIVGLTGGIASGKSSIANVFKPLIFEVIDCDKLGHLAYKSGTDCYEELIKAFGDKIIGEDKEINRKVLGSIVFNNREELKRLTDIVWPHIAILVHKEIEKISHKWKLIVLDAAVLLEANWDQFCHEVWVCILDKEESIQRVIRRDDCTEEDAIKRIESQLSDKERLEKAHIVFCTKWSYRYTGDQVCKALEVLAEEYRI